MRRYRFHPEARIEAQAAVVARNALLGTEKMSDVRTNGVINAHPRSMGTQPATRDEIRTLLGDADDLMVKRVLETGASTDEIAEALRSLANEDEADAEAVTYSTNVANVRAILGDLAASEDDDDRVVPADVELEEPFTTP